MTSERIDLAAIRARVERLAEAAQAADAENNRLAAEVARLSRWLDRSITPEDATQYALGILAAGSLGVPNCTEFGGTIERPDGTKRTAVVSVQWVDGKSPHQLLAERTVERDAARLEIVSLRGSIDLRDMALNAANAIIAGRTTAPTGAEADDHPGAFLWMRMDRGEAIAITREGCEREGFDSIAFGFVWFREDLDDELPRAVGGRWWALDASGAPCAWPVVTKEVE